MDQANTTTLDTLNTIMKAHDVPTRRKALVTRAALGAICVVILFQTASNLSALMSYGDVTFWAQRVERDLPIDVATLDRLNVKMAEIVDKKICISQFAKATLSLRLVSVDLARSYESWFKSIQEADTAVRYALSCFPTDGNIWLRLAMVRGATAEEPGQLMRYIHLSASYTPSDFQVLKGRYIFFNRLTGNSLNRLKDDVLNDMRILCRPENLNFRSGLPAPSSHFAAIIEKTAPSCSPLI